MYAKCSESRKIRKQLQGAVKDKKITSEGWRALTS